MCQIGIITHSGKVDVYHEHGRCFGECIVQKCLSSDTFFLPGAAYNELCKSRRSS